MRRLTNVDTISAAKLLVTQNTIAGRLKPYNGDVVDDVIADLGLRMHRRDAAFENR